MKCLLAVIEHYESGHARLRVVLMIPFGKVPGVCRSSNRLDNGARNDEHQLKSFRLHTLQTVSLSRLPVEVLRATII